MARFRKRPVEIDAVRFTGSNFDEVKAFAGTGATGVDSIGFLDFSPKFDVSKLILFSVQTLEGEMVLSPGNWLVKGVKGEFYPVRNDIFEATYEQVS